MRVCLDKEGIDRVFTDPFTIGRDEGCEVQVASSVASRQHAEVYFEADVWHLRDLGSTNGTFVDGERVSEMTLQPSNAVRLGTDGPVLKIEVDLPEQESPSAPITRRSPRPAVPPRSSSAGADMGGRTAKPSALETDGPSLGSTQEYAQYYFGDGGDSEGGRTHTQMIRRAYASVQKEQQRRYRWIVGVAVAVGVLALGFAVWQSQRAGDVEDVYYALRSQEAEIARIRTVLEERQDATLEEQLSEMEARRAELAQRYEGYIEEYGIRRELSEEEQVIFKVARIFNESHREMPAQFVRAVREQIRVWQTVGRRTFISGIKHAEEEGYTPLIVRTMQKYDLPPEFFYLALQESNLRRDAVGPWTRYGHAKGMWQFIPETATAYGLDIGPRADEGTYDELDERHDVPKATDAAARYLRDIYGHLAQASGLLAMASYNWGEHRVVGKLDALLEDIPDDPRARSYWRFYTVYSDRMPQQTKDYVIKIFAAAVIGDNPRLFGFDFDDPLQQYMDTSGDVASATVE